MRLKLAEVVLAAFYAAGGELIVRLCARSERLDYQRELALVRRQLAAARKFGAYWHAKACNYQQSSEMGDDATLN